MPANLPLLLASRPSLPPSGPDWVDSSRGFLVTHPRYRAWLHRAGIISPGAALHLQGEIVSGHPARHVVRVELLGRRVVYLKREHVVGWRTRFKNALAGFGWVSRSEREAVTLQRLEQAGLPGPQWLAYGEDGHGQAFLLVDELANAENLRSLCRDSRLTAEDRRLLAEQFGRSIAELHAAGFGTPDLTAKHVFVTKDSGSIVCIDWQSAGPVDIVRQLSNLSASLPEELVASHDRLRFFWAYHRVLRQSSAVRLPRFGTLARAIQKRHRIVSQRSSLRDQRQHGSEQRLVWLAGEAVCVVPDRVSFWPTPPDGPPFYTNDPGSQCVTFPDGCRATLTRFVTVDPGGRLMATLRGQPWRSPGATVGRVLVHLARYGIPAPRLLGFGQRCVSVTRAESFVVYQPSADLCALPRVLSTSTADRRKCLWESGALLRRLHDAGCGFTELDAGDSFFASNPDAGGAVEVENPLAIRLTRDRNRRRSDLRLLTLRLLPNLSRADRGWVVNGYAAGDAPVLRRSLLRAVMS